MHGCFLAFYIVCTHGLACLVRYLLFFASIIFSRVVGRILAISFLVLWFLVASVLLWLPCFLPLLLPKFRSLFNFLACIFASLTEKSCDLLAWSPTSNLACYGTFSLLACLLPFLWGFLQFPGLVFLVLLPGCSDFCFAFLASSVVRSIANSLLPYLPS